MNEFQIKYQLPMIEYKNVNTCHSNVDSCFALNIKYFTDTVVTLTPRESVNELIYHIF